mgnify:CR=1 FL=1
MVEEVVVCKMCRDKSYSMKGFMCVRWSGYVGMFGVKVKGVHKVLD